MYNFFKSIGKIIVPKRVLKKFEPLFRNLISYKYRGDRYQCNICETKLNTFVILKHGDLLCPSCGSRSRTRRLYSILSNMNLKGSLLHFSPSNSIYSKLNERTSLNYYSTDFSGEFNSDYNFNITDISIKDDYFETILCFHILEHIEDDISAMKELYRVLKSDGLCLIQTPYKEGDIYEDSSLTSEKERTKAFGQKDHLRIYSVKGLTKRLESVGFLVEPIAFKNESTNHYNGFKEETVLFCKKI